MPILVMDESFCSLTNKSNEENTYNSSEECIDYAWISSGAVVVA